MIIIGFLILMLWIGYCIFLFNWLFDLADGKSWGLVVYITLSLLPIILLLQVAFGGKQ